MNYKPGQLMLSPGVYYIFIIIGQISDMSYECYIVTDAAGIHRQTKVEYREATKSFLNACSIMAY